MRLFTPTRLGDLALRNRVVLAPLTRRRADPQAVPSASAPLYYAQRADAGLIVSEGTCISAEGIGDRRLPGLWTDEQIARWRTVTEAVHARAGLIVAQLWHTGRASHPLLQAGGEPAVAPSAIAIEKDRELDGEIIPSTVPRALETGEIARVVSDYAVAAENAIGAGFDGVELHGANGYLIDEFLQDGSNVRTDQYGGSVEARTLFLREVLEAVTGTLGKERVGLRISPSSMFQSMQDSEPYVLWARVLEVVAEFDLAFLHVVEPGVSGSESHRSHADGIDSAWIRARYPGRLIAAGRYTAESAEAAVEAGQVDAVAFGRLFTSNPDLPVRLRARAALTPPDRTTFYTAGDEGYVDWPSLEAEKLLRELESGSRFERELEADLSSAEFGGSTSYSEWEAAWALSRYRRIQDA
ncbi:alkene reductase [Microbacterium sp. LRZ72]|uniref:alkene reductase n=1 Tax=Microbacterium sp. LRZ72 TaxID=2942481 RepID=UPI0029A07FB0|nr:alkene reductase [Microbacterium sp. LRZ72]MDX2376118.1 alkene reductase [Microbacterium sp. LRZ72]